MSAVASYTVTLTDGRGDDRPVSFAARSDRSIVRSAAAAGYALTTGCLQGRCAICRARLVTGEVAALRRAAKHALADPAHRADGCVLLCSVGPRSDLVLEVLSPWAVAGIHAAAPRHGARPGADHDGA